MSDPTPAEEQAYKTGWKYGTEREQERITRQLREKAIRGDGGVLTLCLPLREVENIIKGRMTK